MTDIPRIVEAIKKLNALEVKELSDALYEQLCAKGTPRNA